MRLIESLLKSVRNTARFNPDIQVAPACILWPDRDRQWEAVIPRLQAEIPELLVLGDYQPNKRTGPAIWLRCALAGNMDGIHLLPDFPPIIYLPGVSRQDLRAVENCPDALKPLAELQYRGVIWSQINAKDWTVLAFLKSDQGGLGLDVAQDNDTKSAMQLALYRLLDEETSLLQGKPLGKDYFNTLLTGGDPVRDLLQWLDQGDSFQQGRTENEWKGFVEVCKSQLGFNPQIQGVLAGASKLATHEGAWQAVWSRFCEAPHRYPNIPDQISRCKPPLFDLFTSVETASGWPQWNQTEEDGLRRELQSLNTLPPHVVSPRLLELEKKHAARRLLVWAELGKSPLAHALGALAVLVDTTRNNLASGTLQDLMAGYATSGWQADHAVMKALAAVEEVADVEAVSTAIRCVYLPWLEASARHLQKLVCQGEYPGGTIRTVKTATYAQGECILFVDGLRFDTAKSLTEKLERLGYSVAEQPVWAALPSVTATGKAAVTPVRDKISGTEGNTDFEPSVAATGQSLKGGYHLKKLLTDNGWTLLERSDNGNAQGNAWYEFGDIDHEGHDRGWKLAKHLDTLLDDITERITALLQAGWSNIRVVTDHGWLLMPGGLPKTTLPANLVDSKWGRCAALKSGVTSAERLYPWYWNPDQPFALADGISCFRNGDEYAHGGLSLQECLTLELTVSHGNANTPRVAVTLTDAVWRGLRCKVAADGDFKGLSVDIRTQAANPDSSIILTVKALDKHGQASVVVENDELEGSHARLVLIDPQGKLIAEMETMVGGEHA